MTQQAPESRQSALLLGDKYGTHDFGRNRRRARPRVPFLSLLRLFLVAFPAAGLILGFALLTGYFVIQDSYLEATISVITVLAWIAATTEAIDLAIERYS